ncbi:glycopeptide [Lentinula guzmanii]|uniref:Glycopeptide n=1 Tax=Lentinula guzmanii TaxID=2804957 RepID=A0AA38J4X6_9AGAR|nr:glycopeptide [Lentinula guzmanii]
MFWLFLNLAAFTATISMGVQAETHTVTLSNYCGSGIVLQFRFSYLDTGNHSSSCGTNGEGCTVLETTLDNAQGSSTTFNMTSYSIPTGFGYFNGCDGEGWDCTNLGCPGATGIISPLPIRCTAENVGNVFSQTFLSMTNVIQVDLAVTFCD